MARIDPMILHRFYSHGRHAAAVIATAIVVAALSLFAHQWFQREKARSDGAVVVAWAHRASSALRDLHSALACYKQQELGWPTSVVELYKSGCASSVVGSGLPHPTTERAGHLLQSAEWWEFDGMFVRRIERAPSARETDIIAIVPPSDSVPDRAAILRMNGDVSFVLRKEWRSEACWPEWAGGLHLWPSD